MYSVLYRSTFPGAGRFTAHWTGDNGVNWENLYMSIAGIINTNMWGMAMVGADICGFADMAYKEGGSGDIIPDKSLQELCNRSVWLRVWKAGLGCRQHGIKVRRHHPRQVTAGAAHEVCVVEGANSHAPRRE